MDPFTHYLLTGLRLRWQVLKNRKDAGLTSTEMALLLAALLAVATGVVVAVTARTNQEKAKITGS